MRSELLASLDSAAVGIAASLLLVWLYRTFVPVVRVSLSEIEVEHSTDILRLALEVENRSRVKLNRRQAALQITARDLPDADAWHTDWLDPDSCSQEEVLRTDRLEPGALLHTEVLYRWGETRAIQCRLYFEYGSWLLLPYLGRTWERHSVVKWFVRPEHINEKQDDPSLPGSPEIAR